MACRAPAFYRNKYQNRYHDLHVDVMDSLSGYGASMRLGLATIGPGLGLSAKSFLDRPIYAHVLDGDVECCKNDTLDTLLVFLS